MKETISIVAPKAHFQNGHVVVDRDTLCDLELKQGSVLYTVSRGAINSEVHPYDVHENRVRLVKDGTAYIDGPEHDMTPFDTRHANYWYYAKSIFLSHEDITRLKQNIRMLKNRNAEPPKPGKLAIIYGFNAELSSDHTSVTVDGFGGSKPIPVAIGSTVYLAKPLGSIVQYQVTDIDDSHVSIQCGDDNLTVPRHGRTPIINHMSVIDIDDDTYEKHQQSNMLENQLKGLADLLTNDDVSVDEKLKQLQFVADRAREQI